MYFSVARSGYGMTSDGIGRAEEERGRSRDENGLGDERNYDGLAWMLLGVYRLYGPTCDADVEF